MLSYINTFFDSDLNLITPLEEMPSVVIDYDSRHVGPYIQLIGLNPLPALGFLSIQWTKIYLKILPFFQSDPSIRRFTTPLCLPSVCSPPLLIPISFRPIIRIP